MPSSFRRFESIVRRASNFTDARPGAAGSAHPFDERNIHPDLPSQVRKLFDDGHYANASLEAFKFVAEEIQRISGSSDFGTSLMMRVFGGTPPLIAVNPGKTISEKNEQEGFKFLFAGAMQGIRNPRGHTTRVIDSPDTCLDYLGLASMLLRRLDQAKVR